MKISQFSAILALSLCTQACGEMNPPAEPQPPTQTTLRVSLFPWIPEAESFFAWIEEDFERQHPDIDLIVRAVKKSHDWEPEYVADLSYEYEQTAEALTGDGADAQDLVEVDTMLLGWLHSRDAIVPFEVGDRDYLPFAQQAVSLGGEVYGAPHWTCGYFVISEDPAIRQAADRAALLETLAARETDAVDLVGDLDGSWDSVMVYVDALHDGEPERDLVTALDEELIDPAVAESFSAIGAACTKDGVNGCDSDGVDVFARGEADALIGYSERLNPILADADRSVGELHVASAPLGDGDHPVLFTDALVLSPLCAERCREAAQQFAAYYNSDEVFETALLARDVGDDAVPRYLLPATASAFETEGVAAERLYGELRTEIEGAVPYPITGVPEARARGSIRAQIQTALGISP
ncbi:lipoprotein [Haliangium ochraceum]|uniref:Putative lipoprotein n=1 Tax=Haliangium ochraceum (strain DSM 14365 / JCM 11303 / SMP-2) TaxID=502025 RepID=D0LUQ4_HALO1|nr:lipoprotein [Haliangium ochraceum]ACY13944.1 putative lipoprotein [Haliangium ochraceum DSM 14365]